MKLNRILLASVFCALIWLGYNQIASKEVAYITSDRLVTEYRGMKDARSSFKQKQKTWQTNLDSLQSQYERALKIDKIKAQAYLQNITKYQSQIQTLADKEDREMTQTVLDQINTFTELFGEKHGYDLILGTTSEGNVLYGKKSLDITSELLDALNHYYATGEVK